MTYEEFIANVKKLDITKEYNYISNKGKFKLTGVENGIVKTLVAKEDLSKKESSVSKNIIEAYLTELAKGSPVDCAKVSGESGSNRSIPPSLLCLMPHIFALKKNKRAHIIELKEKSHNLGELEFIVEKDIDEKKKQMHSTGNEPFQKIFFGAPGTGKSHKIDYNLFKDKDGNLIGKGIKEIPKDRKFRTTFHPDYDYAQFVGAYKPKKVQNIDNGTLSKDQLAQKLSDVFPNNGDVEIDKTTAITLFGLQYANSLKGKNMNEIVRLSKIGEDQYKSAYLSAAVKARLQLSDVDEKITYSFVPQVFAKAYAAAWKQYFAASNASTANNQVYLVIEEINRGNCAQIFGDIFQLLDRKVGYSDYPIDVDSDFASYIKEQLSNVKQSDGTIANYWDAYKSKIQEWDSSEQDEEFADGDFCKIALPPNLNILATMNTSDQSLFPMDSAFKRRFDWEYVPINYDHPKAHFAIKVGNTNYDWLDFLKKINENIDEVTKSEDKKLGEFFIKPKDGKTIDLEEFRSKVLFYLWDSVYKDEDGNTDAEKVFHFNIEDGKKDKMTFQKLFDREKGVQYVNTIMGKDHLNVDQYKENDTPVTESQHSSETTINTDTGTAEETTDDTAEPAQT